MNKKKRIAFFCHWDKDNIIDDYVIYYIKGLKKISNHIVFISNCNISESEKQKISSFTIDIIVRENKGYDFMAWKDGIFQFGFGELSKYDELIIVNDSCYAPLYDLQLMFNEMDNQSCDFWGVTESYQKKHHLQSYFLVFKNKLFMTKSFREFWENVIARDKDDVILKYELGLTDFLVKEGFRFKSFMKYNVNILKFIKIKFNRILCFIKYKGKIPKSKKHSQTENDEKNNFLFKILNFTNIKTLNLMSIFWDELIIKGCPFVKVETIRDNPYMLKNLDNWDDFLTLHTTYKTKLIKEHLKRLNQ